METKPFVFSRVTWHEVTEKIAIAPIEDALNASLNPTSYGRGIQQIRFTYLAVQPTNQRHQNAAWYNKKTKIVEVALGLSYSDVQSASPERIREMMTRLFLVSLDLYERWEIEDFDLSAFREDVEKLFSSHGWLKPILQD